MKRAWFQTPWRLSISLVAAALLFTACGSDDAPSDGGDGPAGPVTVTGTAATGAAIANAGLEIRCKVGTASTTTADDGTYAVELPEDAELPCLLRVTLADGSMLHSVLGSGSTVANVTSVTELVVARLAGESAEAYFDSFDADVATTLDEEGDIQGAVDAVVAILTAAGVDFGPDIVDNVLTGELIAAHGSVPGNAYDEKLDELGKKLAASGTTLATLSDEIVRSIPTDPQAGLSSVASLPADLLLSPAAANCSALRSGSYRVLILAASAGPDVKTEVAQLDATTLTLTWADGSVQQWLANGHCAYTTNVGDQAVVSPAGLIVASVYRPGPGAEAALLFPEQVLVDADGHPSSENVAQLAGNWNGLALQQTTSAGPVHLTTSSFTLNGAGRVKTLTVCDTAVGGCTTAPLDQVPSITLSLNDAGGFDLVDATSGSSSRAFVYRAGGGELMIVTLSLDGQLGFATRQLAAALPLVDEVRESWDLALSISLAVGPSFADMQSTVTAVDDALGQYQQSAVIDFGANLTRPETIVINDPREGYRYRPAATVTDSNGGSSLVTEQLGLPLLGMGLTPIGVLADNGLNLSVQKPAH